MARAYRVWRTGGDTVLRVQGDMAGFLGRWSLMFPKYVNRVIRHCAYMAQWRMKAELLAHAPGGEVLPDITAMQSARWLDAFKGGSVAGNMRPVYQRGHKGGARARGLAYGMNGAEWPLAGKLTQAIGYQVHDMARQGRGWAEIGWLSRSAARLGAKFQEGGDVPVTDRMRRLFFAAGLGISPAKTVIHMPPRPVMYPFYKNRRDWMAETMIRRFHYHFQNDAVQAAAQMARRYAPFPARGRLY